MSRHPLLWSLALALAGCVAGSGDEAEVVCPEGAFARPDRTCTEPWICPDGWRRMDGGVACEPPPLREDCPPGGFAVPTGACTPVWACPEGWHRIEDVPPTGEDGVPLRPRLDIGCEPPSLREDCPPGSFAVPTGACTPVWE